jgi:hypothetical protein
VVASVAARLEAAGFWNLGRAQRFADMAGWTSESTMPWTAL